MGNIANPIPDFASGSAEMTVIVFDMCSSSTILADLQSQQKLHVFVDLVQAIDQHLWGARTNRLSGNAGIEGIEFFSYKFVGDGWVLLFPNDISPTSLIRFMHLLSMKFETSFHYAVASHLLSRPSHVGFRFGVDMGWVHKFRLRAREEFVGMPIVVATRLQSAATSFESEESDTVLVSETAFAQFFKIKEKFARYRPKDVSLSFPSQAVLFFLEGNRVTRRRAEEKLAKAGRGSFK